MRNLILVGALLVTGCQGVVGPFQRARLPDPVDDRRLSISEQERKGRDRLSYPDDIPAATVPSTALTLPTTARDAR
jgi:hypothetical protein